MNADNPTAIIIVFGFVMRNGIFFSTPFVQRARSQSHQPFTSRQLIRMQRTATIIGAGIAGLSTAVALRRSGWKTTVLESAPEVRSTGAGLTLAANAIQAMHHLGLGTAVAERGTVIRRLEIRDHRGRTLSTMDPTIMPHPLIAIQRSDLHAILLESAGAETVETGYRIDNVAAFLDQCDSDLIVAAEGIHSPTRQHFLPDATARYAGYVSWRGLVHAPEFHTDVATETWGPFGRVGIVPVGNGQIYWFATANSEHGATWPRSMGARDLADRFADYHAPLAEIIGRTPESALLLNEIADLDPVRTWAFDNTILIGDAAHATTPNLGQGACQAIEDAVVLSYILQLSTNIPDGLQEFQRRRIKRTSTIVRRSRQLGRVAQISNPVGGALRNTMLRLTPQRTNDRQLREIGTFTME